MAYCTDMLSVLSYVLGLAESEIITQHTNQECRVVQEGGIWVGVPWGSKISKIMLFIAFCKYYRYY